VVEEPVRIELERIGAPQIRPPLHQKHGIWRHGVVRDVEWLPAWDFGRPERRLVRRSHVEWAASSSEIVTRTVKTGTHTGGTISVYLYAHTLRNNPYTPV
jgi:hypothetical protein